MEVYGGRHNRKLIGVRIRRFSVEDLHNRLFLRYKIITLISRFVNICNRDTLFLVHAKELYLAAIFDSNSK